MTIVNIFWTFILKIQFFIFWPVSFITSIASFIALSKMKWKIFRVWSSLHDSISMSINIESDKKYQWISSPANRKKNQLVWYEWACFQAENLQYSLFFSDGNVLIFHTCIKIEGINQYDGNVNCREKGVTHVIIDYGIEIS